MFWFGVDEFGLGYDLIENSIVDTWMEYEEKYVIVFTLIEDSVSAS